VLSRYEDFVKLRHTHPPVYRAVCDTGKRRGNTAAQQGRHSKQITRYTGYVSLVAAYFVLSAVMPARGPTPSLSPHTPSTNESLYATNVPSLCMPAPTPFDAHYFMPTPSLARGGPPVSPLPPPPSSQPLCWSSESPGSEQGPPPYGNGPYMVAPDLLCPTQPAWIDASISPLLNNALSLDTTVIP